MLCQRVAWLQPTVISSLTPHRKALEMGCFIQSSLAKILADFEIALEHDVLQPLNKLSEVALAALLAPLSHLTSPCSVPKPLQLALVPLTHRRIFPSS